MEEEHKRYPVKHFFIMSRIQWRYIIRIMGSVFLITLAVLLTVVVVYHLKFKTGYFYYMTEDMNADLIRHNIWSLIIPSFLPSALASIIIGLNISLYSSRKIALPIFKIRKWSENLFAGNFNYEVTVRKKDDMGELVTACNQVARKYSMIFRQIQGITATENKPPEEKIEELKRVIGPLKIESK
ncbi:hypothetical protein ACFL5V_04355 [Fibrobacterota bacterium]